MVAFALTALLGGPATAAATSTAAQIAALNAQREANGIPAGIVEVPAWTEGCRHHMAYIAANGGTLTHEESPSNPGYTTDGAEVGRRAVLTPLGDAFNAAGNAFEFAPLHLMQVLSPALSRMGVWGGCATTIAGYDRKASRPALYTYPGDGATGVYASETADELPFVPGDFVGLPRGTTTGPHLYLLAHGTAAGRIASATLTGPAGPVAIRSVDNATEGLAGYLPPGGIIIPVAPLAPGAYTATATFQPGRGAPLSRTWRFAASATANPRDSTRTTYVPVVLRIERARAAGRSVRFTLVAGRSLVGRRASVAIYRVVRRCAGCAESRRGRPRRSTIRRLAASQRIVAPRPAKGSAIKVVVSTRAFTRSGLSYAAGLAVARWSAR